MNPRIAETESLFGQMLDGEMSDAEIERVLVELADKGETAEDIAGAVLAMRARMKTITAPANSIDVCGTGGDGQHSLNVSTATAIVVASCGVPVAKHGNRAASSKAGTADTFEALGLKLDRASEMAEQTLAEMGIAFLFAQAHHPAMRHVMPIRKKLGRRTIFNLIGPLANPAGVKRQLVGVASPVLVPVYRDAMELLGTQAALICSGEEGLDEISIDGPTRLAAINLPGIGERITPAQAGLASHPLEELRGGDAQFNAAALSRLLQGEDGAYRNAVLINTAAALIVAGEVSGWHDGAREAAEAIDKGLAGALLERWVDLCK
ncbi:MAG: anthranilate phosphoribosyltransferase [Sphingomonadaceae bacterium]|nr:anthranilate phosphoribosyltransferase [Sphingomonadaceae bacterium]